MKNEEVGRSVTLIDRDQFNEMTKLIQKQTWLAKRAKALFDTVTLCQSPNESMLILDLLDRFTFESEQGLKESIEEIARVISCDWRCDPKRTIITSTNNGEFSDSSDMMAYRLKSALANYEDWMTHNFINKLGEALTATPSGGMLILVDDFSGTGTSIKKKIEWLSDQMIETGKTVEIRIAVATAMKTACDEFSQAGLTFHIVKMLKKGISDHYAGEELKTCSEAMQRLESELSKKFRNKKLRDYSFGYKSSEALYYAEGLNPPNNNFPVFWWPFLKGKQKRDTVLRRI